MIEQGCAGLRHRIKARGAEVASAGDPPLFFSIFALGFFEKLRFASHRISARVSRACTWAEYEPPVVKFSIYSVLEVDVIFQVDWPPLPGRLKVKIQYEELDTEIHAKSTGPFPASTAPASGLVKCMLQVGVSVGTGVAAGEPVEQHSDEAMSIAAEASKGAILPRKQGLKSYCASSFCELFY